MNWRTFKDRIPWSLENDTLWTHKEVPFEMTLQADKFGYEGITRYTNKHFPCGRWFKRYVPITHNHFEYVLPPDQLPEWPELPEDPNPYVPPDPSMIVVSAVFSAGEDRFGCLGVGSNYVLNVGPPTADVQSVSMSDSPIVNWINSETEPEPDAIIFSGFFGEEIAYDLLSVEYDTDLDLWKVTYVVNESSLPLTVYYGERTYTYEGYTNGVYLWNSIEYGPPTVTLVWPVINSYTLVMTGEMKWVHTDGQTSFIIDLDGKLYSCGSNARGCLGTGEVTGYYSIGSNIVPNHYTSTFARVGSDTDWSMISGSDYGSEFPTIYALKTDGSLWTCGAYDGGTSTTANIYKSHFTKVDNGPWIALFWGGIGLVKEISNGYELWLNDGQCNFSFYMSFTNEEWESLFGGDPITYAKACQGFFVKGSFDYGRTFVGGSISDVDDKQLGTLWDKDNSEDIPQLIRPEIGWYFTAGFLECEDGTISGGANISCISVT